MTRLARRLWLRWANATSAQHEAGADWYVQARLTAYRIARENGSNLREVSGVIAALSPRLHWTANVRAAERLVTGQDVPGVFMGSLVKAQRIWAGEKPLAVLSGPKVRAFYRALIGHSHVGVVDVWVARAAGIKGSLTKKRYAEVVQALTDAAFHASVPVTTLQATVWVAERGRA